MWEWAIYTAVAFYSVAFLMLAPRIVAFVATRLGRVYLWRRGATFSVDSLQLSPLSGCIAFKGLRYGTADASVVIVHGSVSLAIYNWGGKGSKVLVEAGGVQIFARNRTAFYSSIFAPAKEAENAPLSTAFLPIEFAFKHVALFVGNRAVSVGLSTTMSALSGRVYFSDCIRADIQCDSLISHFVDRPNVFGGIALKHSNEAPAPYKQKLLRDLMALDCDFERVFGATKMPIKEASKLFSAQSMLIQCSMLNNEPAIDVAFNEPQFVLGAEANRKRLLLQRFFAPAIARTVERSEASDRHNLTMRMRSEQMRVTTPVGDKTILSNFAQMDVEVIMPLYSDENNFIRYKVSASKFELSTTAPIITASSFVVTGEMPMNLQWNAPQMRKTAVSMDSAQIFPLNEHNALFSQFARDFTSNSSVADEALEEYFVSVGFGIDFTLHRSTFFLLANEANIVDVHCSLADNAYLCVGVQQLSAHVDILPSVYMGKTMAVDAKIAVHNCRYSFNFPKCSTLSAFARIPFGSFGDLTIGAAIRFHQEKTIDTVDLQIEARNVNVPLYGYFIAHLSYLAENYTATYSTTLRSYKQNGVNSPVNVPGNLKKITLKVCAVDAIVKLPTRIFVFDDCVDIGLAHMNCDIVVFDGRIDTNVSVEKCTLGPLLVEDVKVIDTKIGSHNHGDIAINSIRGECDGKLVSNLSAFVSCLLFSMCNLDDRISDPKQSIPMRNSVSIRLNSLAIVLDSLGLNLCALKVFFDSKYDKLLMNCAVEFEALKFGVFAKCNAVDCTDSLEIELLQILANCPEGISIGEIDGELSPDVIDPIVRLMHDLTVQDEMDRMQISFMNSIFEEKTESKTVLLVPSAKIVCGDLSLCISDCVLGQRSSGKVQLFVCGIEISFDFNSLSRSNSTLAFIPLVDISLPNDLNKSISKLNVLLSKINLPSFAERTEFLMFLSQHFVDAKVLSDPEFLVSPSLIWRQAERSHQISSGWRLLQRCRNVYNMKAELDAKESNESTDLNLNNSTILTPNDLIEAFAKWRHWETGDLKANSLVNFILNRNGKSKVNIGKIALCSINSNCEIENIEAFADSLVTLMNVQSVNISVEDLQSIIDALSQLQFPPSKKSVSMSTENLSTLSIQSVTAKIDDIEISSIDICAHRFNGNISAVIPNVSVKSCGISLDCAVNISSALNHLLVDIKSHAETNDELFIAVSKLQSIRIPKLKKNKVNSNEENVSNEESNSTEETISGRSVRTVMRIALNCSTSFVAGSQIGLNFGVNCVLSDKMHLILDNIQLQLPSDCLSLPQLLMIRTGAHVQFSAGVFDGRLSEAATRDTIRLLSSVSSALSLLPKGEASTGTFSANVKDLSLLYLPLSLKISLSNMRFSSTDFSLHLSVSLRDILNINLPISGSLGECTSIEANISARFFPIAAKLLAKEWKKLDSVPKKDSQKLSLFAKKIICKLSVDVDCQLELSSLRLKGSVDFQGYRNQLSVQTSALSLQQLKAKTVLNAIALPELKVLGFILDEAASFNFIVLVPQYAITVNDFFSLLSAKKELSGQSSSANKDNSSRSALKLRVSLDFGCGSLTVTRKTQIEEFALPKIDIFVETTSDPKVSFVDVSVAETQLGISRLVFERILILFKTEKKDKEETVNLPLDSSSVIFRIRLAQIAVSLLDNEADAQLTVTIRASQLKLSGHITGGRLCMTAALGEAALEMAHNYALETAFGVSIRGVSANIDRRTRFAGVIASVRSLCVGGNYRYMSECLRYCKSWLCLLPKSVEVKTPSLLRDFALIDLCVDSIETSFVLGRQIGRLNLNGEQLNITLKLCEWRIESLALNLQSLDLICPEKLSISADCSLLALSLLYAKTGDESVSMLSFESYTLMLDADYEKILVLWSRPLQLRVHMTASAFAVELSLERVFGFASKQTISSVLRMIDAIKKAFIDKKGEKDGSKLEETIDEKTNLEQSTLVSDSVADFSRRLEFTLRSKSAALILFNASFCEADALEARVDGLLLHATSEASAREVLIEIARASFSKMHVKPLEATKMHQFSWSNWIGYVADAQRTKIVAVPQCDLFMESVLSDILRYKFTSEFSDRIFISLNLALYRDLQTVFKGGAKQGPPREPIKGEALTPIDFDPKFSVMGDAAPDIQKILALIGISKEKIALLVHEFVSEQIDSALKLIVNKLSQ